MNLADRRGAFKGAPETDRVELHRLPNALRRALAEAVDLRPS